MSENFAGRLSVALKALIELGPAPLARYAAYRLGLTSGYLRWRTPEGWPGRSVASAPLRPQPGFELPDRAALLDLLGEKACAATLEAADEVLAGQVRLFGGDPLPLRLAPAQPLAHWTEYARGRQPWGAGDVKLVWEPARFAFALLLARAYHLSQDERYTRGFWDLTEAFLDANPPNLGPHWASAQEVALRLVALAFAGTVFAKSVESTGHRLARLGEALAAHAERIPATLGYARAQNNNHLLTEAVGLYTAAAFLPAHPRAGRWRALGWRWLNRAFQAQIAPDGTYVQHSSNYHRLMLEVALWAARVARQLGQELPPATRQCLAAATSWALGLHDPTSGRLPNLGPNDGACMLPLTSSSFEDHRPVLQAAGEAFLGARPFPPGPWDELCAWLGPLAPAGQPPEMPEAAPRVVLRSQEGDSWAYLRVARFDSRPGHADQLHLDLWWRGLNVAQDAGTYLYNAPPPWENSLAGTAVHNTVTVDGLDQMQRAGRFLWLDWAQADVVRPVDGQAGSSGRVAARHNGYQRLGVIHQRSVSTDGGSTWQIRDELLADSSGRPAASIRARLHWLLPDWPWELHGSILRMRSPFGWVRLAVSAGLDDPAGSGSLPGGEGLQVQLARAGELLAGEGLVDPTRGWAALTYARKAPALSFSVTVAGKLPVVLLSQWEFP